METLNFTESSPLPSQDYASALMAEQFLNIASQLSIEFLTCGGPVTRLETLIVQAGAQAGYETSVTATPASVVIFCYDPNSFRTYSRGARIQDFTIDLGGLRRVDRLLNLMAIGQLSPSRATIRLNKIKQTQKVPSLLSYYFCMFFIGMGAGLLIANSFVDVIWAGVFSLGVQIVMRVAEGSGLLPDFFQDFLVCFITFFSSVIIGTEFGIHPAVLSLGIILYIVPGLQMTTAISEIVDQNYLSGTIRFLKAFYTFLSMAMAYYLAKDLLSGLGFNGLNEAIVFTDDIPTKLFGALMILYCVSVQFRAHKKSLPRILLCGLSGALTLFVLSQYISGVAATTLAATTIGFLSYAIARYFNHPSQIYSVPSILILVPGMLAFTSVGFGRGIEAQDFMVTSVATALVISLAIVFGLALGRSIGQKLLNSEGAQL